MSVRSTSSSRWWSPTGGAVVAALMIGGGVARAEPRPFWGGYTEATVGLGIHDGLPGHGSAQLAVARGDGGLRLWPARDDDGVSVRLGLSLGLEAATDHALGGHVAQLKLGPSLEVDGLVAPRWRVGGRLAYDFGEAHDPIVGVRVRHDLWTFGADLRLADVYEQQTLPTGVRSFVISAGVSGRPAAYVLGAEALAMVATFAIAIACCFD